LHAGSAELVVTANPNRVDSDTTWVLDVPGKTILKLVATAALIWVWLQVWDIFLLLLAAVLLAVALDPAVSWLERRGVSRGFCAVAIVVGILGILTVFVLLAGSSLVSEGRVLGAQLKKVEEELTRRAPGLVRLLPGSGDSRDISSAMPYVAFAGRQLVIAVVELVVAFVLTMYLLADGRRTYAWLLAYVPKKRRARAHATACQARQAIVSYIIGNVATSIFALLFVLICLSLLHVPAALLLALLAGVFDFIPVLGFIASAAPAILLALSKSATVALIVAGLYVLYHTIENYAIAPRIYGGRLRLSPLAVLMAFAIGAEVGGIIGAAIALPLAAMYPVIERLWLRRYLGADVVETHTEIENGEFDEETIPGTVLNRG
jgi:predicted PurR-regulated permease PerM